MKPLGRVDFVVIVHRLYFDGMAKKGGLDQILSYLVDHGNSILLFEYPLQYAQSLKLKLTLVSKHEQRVLKELNLFSKRSSVNWLIELLFSLYYSYKYKNGCNYIVTSDPLTSLPAVIMRKLHMFKFHYYHSVDYSTDRFHNAFLNFAYVTLLAFGLKNADLVSVVTEKARKRLEKIGVKDIFFMPNSPDFHALDVYRKPFESRIPNSLVLTCSEVSHKYMIHEVLRIVKNLKQNYHDIVLYVVGNFSLSSEYCRELQNFVDANDLQKNVIFCGNKSLEDNYEIISHCKVGIAIYDGFHSHVTYGDSLKIREYCALGLAVVADKHTDTGVEMGELECGYAVDSVEEMEKKLDELLGASIICLRFSNNALEWAQKNDKRRILDFMLNRYFK